MQAERPPETEATNGEAPREEIEQRLAQHGRQQDAVARLGQIALRDHDLQTLMVEVVQTVTRTLDVEMCSVLKLRDDEELLDILAAVGKKGAPGPLPAGNGTQAGYALRTHGPVVADDLRSETRFDPGPLLAQGMRSGMNALIDGPRRPFGVLSAHARELRSFTADDVNFLVAVANVLSAAVERAEQDQASRHAALHDPLTGLPNRTLALDRLDLALARRRRDGTSVSMLLLDLDRFKIINDSLGHAVGDEILVTLAERLREVLRPSDTVARLGGDEFIVVCESGSDQSNVVELAQRIAAAVGRPFELATGEHFLTASIGIAAAESDDDTSASLLRDADAAMYRAKQRGPGRYELFDATLRAQVIARLQTETELRQALDQGQLRVYYQPIFDVASGRPVAAEALVRWQHPHHGLIPPLDFIPIAEETGLIIELGRYVLEQACAQGRAWQLRFGAPLQMFINVSGCQIANAHFPSEVAEVVTHTGLAAGTLGLEVTESVLIEEAGSSMGVLSELHAHGVRLALDDFGTGYSSLSYLRRFPIDAVKVDRSFIDGLGNKAEDAAIMRAIVEMCRALKLTVVAEGVESQPQLQQLRQLGCERAQGYLLCHPIPAEESDGFLDRRLLAPTITHTARSRRSSLASAATGR
ncbi:MAG TPA: EAL domain-containing protein [Solirubrobacteraceae bacterium]|nr:EAL domain-containing protein [Solirubrobacteraceae bacterium]